MQKRPLIPSYKNRYYDANFYIFIRIYIENLLHSLATLPSLVILYRKIPFTALALASLALIPSAIFWKTASEERVIVEFSFY